MKTVYFGTRWGSAAFMDATEVPVPVGQECLLCHELVVAEDSGTFTGYIDAEGSGTKAVHIECWLRSVMGSPSHVLGYCSCRDSTLDGHLDDERPYREQAKETMKLLESGEAWWGQDAEVS